MKRETIIWTILFVVGGAFLLARGLMNVAQNDEVLYGTAYIEAVPVNPDAEDPNHRWTRYENASKHEYEVASANDPAQDVYRFSLWRSLGIWLAAFFTIAVFSFLYRDNPFYKIAESIFVGVSAAYGMVVGFWDVLVPNLIGKIWPTMVQNWAMPGLSGKDLNPSYWYIVPLVLGIMLLWRLSPKGGWISRWPLAFIIGVFCGLRLIAYLHGDFLTQIRNAIVPLAVMEAGEFQPWDTLKNFFLVAGTLAALVYFFFSVEHKGVVGKTAKVGIFVLMITFGAGFGYTVMGRIALLAIRIEFLVDDWLWLIDPTGKRIPEAAAMLFL